MKLSLLLALILILGTLGWAVPVTSELKPGDGESGDRQALQQTHVAEEMGHKEAFEIEEKKGMSDKRADDTGPVKGKGGEKLPINKGLSEDQKSGGKGKSLSEKKPVKRVEDIKALKNDRRWIIKQKTPDTSRSSPQKPKPLKWKSEKQQVQCNAHIKALNRSLNKARYYSVQGDSCSTARYAKSFVDLVGRCKKECPDSFLQSKGYSKRLIKNVNVLMELGKKHCLN